MELKSNRQRPKDMSELATELEALLRKMSGEQLQQLLDLPLEAEPDAAAIAKRLAKRELTRRQLQ
jgi:hypothetical protein